jgi:hypothetical protein
MGGVGLSQQPSQSQLPQSSLLSKPTLGGKATLPAAIIKPGMYKPKKFQMEMPDEKQSGMYSKKLAGDDLDEDVVESMALEEPKPKPSSLGGKVAVQPKLLGPNIMR